MTRRRLPLLLAVLAAALGAGTPAAHAASPRIAAAGAIVMDAATGDVAYARRPDARRPIASTTKLMTALLAIEDGGLSRVVRAIRYRPTFSSESVVGLRAGEKLTEADLLRALLVVSANDAAMTIAATSGGTVQSFVRRMNRRAQELGLKNTHYANPIGLDDPGNYSSARDLATLTRELRKHRFFRRVVNSETVTLQSGRSRGPLTNRNTLLFEAPWVDGVKTGFTTQAGDVLVASGHKRGVRLISAVLGEPDKATRNRDSLTLLNYGFSRYHRVRAVVRGSVKARVPIAHRAGATLPLVASRTVHRVVRRGERFQYRLSVPDQVDGPVHYGDRIGKVVVEERGKPVASVALTAALEVPAANAARRTQDALTTPWTLVALAGVLAAAAAVSTRRRPPPRDERRRRTPEEIEAA
jgi:D-alanyl-D-alanine carboxypeptidase (penicillin-binding protein 5/6)